MKRTLLFLLAAMAVFVLFARPAFAVVRVVVTIPDYGAIAREIGGANVVVTSLVKPTQDPHFVDAKPSFIVDLSRADLLIYTGMELESGWLPPLLNNCRNAKVQSGGPGNLMAGSVITPFGHVSNVVDRALGDIHSGGNPHFWNDPRSGLRLADSIAERLKALDHDHAADYQANLEKFRSRLTSKMKEWESRLAPIRGTPVVVYHDSWIYFLDWAGLATLDTLEPKPGVPPSPGHVADLARRVQEKKVRAVIQESYYPTNLSKVFAEKTGARLLVLPSMTGAVPGTDGYVELIDKMVSMLTEAIGN